jgi:uncharacterized protein (TIGR03382 family)
MKKLLLGAALMALVSDVAFPVVTMTPLATFGGGDGWLSPGEGGYAFLGTGNNERGIAYNQATGNLLLLSRAAVPLSVRILNGLTGVETGTLAGTASLSGGTFAGSMISATSAGVIYVANLSTAANTAASPFKVYQWTSEAAAAPTTALSHVGNGARLGDTFDAIGTGTGTILAAGYGGTGIGFITATTADGTNFTATNVATSAPVAGGDFRLGLTFVDSDSLIGTQSAAATRFMDFAGPTGTLVTSLSLNGLQRPMDYAVIGGVPYLAAVDVGTTGTSLVQIYDMTNPGAPVSVATGNATSGPLTGNANASGSVKWGAITGNTAILYAMSTNQGIQAFTVTIPEPATLAFAGFGLLGLLRRRR